MIYPHHKLLAALLVTMLAACNPIHSDAEATTWLWRSYGGQPVETVYADWGLPDRETVRHDGSTIREYRHLFTKKVAYDPDAMKITLACYVHIISQSRSESVDDIMLNGSPSACYDLA